MKHFIDTPDNVIYFDTETNGLQLWHGDKPFAFSFANRRMETAYFEFDVDPFTRKPIPQPRVLAKIKRLLEDPTIKKVGHNIKFDVRAMEEGYDIHTFGPVEDTMFKAHACNSLEMTYELKVLCNKYGIMGREDQDRLKEVVKRLRRKVEKLNWKICYSYKPQPHGTPKRKAETAADYWIPRTAFRRGLKDIVTPEEAALCEHYAVKDALRTCILDCFYEQKMDELGARDAYQNIEVALWPIIYDMESRGVDVDPILIDEQIGEAVRKIDAVLPELEKMAWKGFNPNSGQQVREWIIDFLGIEVNKYTKPTKNHPFGQPSIGREWMQENLDRKEVYTLARYRTGLKAFGSFFARYKGYMIDDRISPGEKSLHANFQQVGPATGRLSCRDPNLQNVMDPTVSFSIDPMHVRNVFRPRPGYQWLCVDYSNMEVRVFAAVSGEPNMLQWIREGRDIHSGVANRIWGGGGNPLGIKQAIRALQLDGTGVGTSEKVTSLWKDWGITDPLKLSDRDRWKICDEWLATFNYEIVAAQDSLGRRYARNIGKMITFLKVYGGGMPGARRLLKLPDDEIREILSEYDRNHPRIREYSQELIEDARAEGCIRTLWGRRLAIDPWFAYRAVNYMVQGSSADLMKTSMIKVNRFFRENGLDAHIVLTVHDELISEARRCEMTLDFVQEVCRLMSDSDGRIIIPMPVEPKLVSVDWSKKRSIKGLKEAA